MIPWWGWVLIVAGALGVGGVIGAGALMIYIGQGMWRNW